jgi:3-hydroxyacyl-CoA dehydrogenase
VDDGTDAGIRAGVRRDRQGAIGVITLAAPPVNALGQALRAGLGDALDDLLADPGLRAILILAEGPLFSAGADIREFGGAPAAPLLTDICRRIETAAIPVIAVLQGAALGGGAEIALAAHYRLGGPAARIGLPEVRLGLIPGAGGTQRLPRLIGAEAALTLMTEGQSLDAAEAEAIGLIDGLLPDPTPGAALAFAEGLVARDLGPRPTLSLQDFTAEGGIWLEAVAAARAALAAAPLTAPLRIVDCVEAALLLPPEEGLAYERTAFEDCLASPESAALRHLFLAERRVPQTLGQRGPGGAVALGEAGVMLAARLDAALAQAAAALMRGGLSPASVDAAAVAAGLAVGPFGSAPPGGSEAIARCLIAAVMAEGGRLIDEGHAARAGDVPAARAADVDVVAVAGAGWSRLSGGPMHRASREGLPGLLRDMEAWAADDPVWTPPGVLRRAAKYAGGFDAVATEAPQGAATKAPTGIAPQVSPGSPQQPPS